jgi:integrase
MPDGIGQRMSGGKKVWYARVYYSDKNGNPKQKQRNAKSITHARALRDKMRRELQDAGYRSLEMVKFADLAEEYKGKKLIDAEYAEDMKIAGMRSADRQKVYLKPLEEYFGNLYVQKISYEDLLAYRRYRFSIPSRRGGKRSVAQVNRELSLFRAILNYARREGVITRSPFDQGKGIISHAEEKKRNRIVTPEEEERLLAACTGKRAYLRIYLIMALDTGMRRGEMLGLKWTEIKFNTNLIIAESWKGVGKSLRLIGITARLKEALEAWKPYSTTEFVFDERKDIKKAWKNTLAEANKSEPKILDLRIHDLRHTATTRMVQAGLPAALVMGITGHTQFTTFRRYVNTDEKFAQDAAKALEEFNRDPGRDRKEKKKSKAVRN